MLEKIFRNLHGIFDISLYFCSNNRIATKFKCFDDNFIILATTHLEAFEQICILLC